MAYGKIKADTFVYDNSGSDVEVTLSSLGSKANLPASAGTVGASEVVQVDANKDITGFRNVTLSGNLQVNGTTTTVASSTMTVADKNIELAKGAANDAAADGGGITLESGDGNKTITWVDSTDCWTFNQNIEITGTAPRLIFTDSNNDSDYRINVDGGNFQFQDVTNSNTTRWFINSSGNLLPGADSSYNIGAGSERVSTIYADSFNDPKGDLRKIVQNTQGSAYTLVAADAGKHILASGTVTIPNNVFAAGDAVTIINNTSGNLTLTASVGTLYNTADAATGNRTLATRGMATLLFTSATAAYISGAGLS